MGNNSSPAGPLSCLREDAAVGRRVMSCAAADVLAVSPIAIHEAAHATVARYLGLPVAGVTIIASADFAGLCYAPDTDPNEVTPAMLREEAERRCDDAMTVLPLPGERRDVSAAWVVHAQSSVMECVAGFAAEALAGFDRELEAGSTDHDVAKLYARSVVMSDAAVPSFVESCRIDATQILRDHWLAVTDVAMALDKRKTLIGEEVDAIIYSAESKSMHEAELQRRARMATMKARASQHGSLT